jgi:alanine-glyoxylate transaminase/serine-glyoxylate transaminase/serine-pyruvate transaminase
MPLTDRLLLGPGPSNPYPEVTAAFAQPLLGHLDPDFLAILDETCARLRTVFQTENALTLPISGTGSAGMEACFVNLLEPGDTVIIGVNGVFGERMCEVARRCGAEVERVDAPWGAALDPARLLDAQRNRPDARLVAVVHAETSTGVENDVAPLRALNRRLLLRDTEVPRRAAGPRAPDVLAARRRARHEPRDTAAVVVSRPRLDRRLRGWIP